ncbi:MAG: NAD-dependent epimerase/dehydratase family protein [Acidimicrobiales bacterium]
MRFLITGGAGFIGSHLADHLLAQGHAVTVVDDLSTGRHANIEHLLGRPDFEFVLGSILNPDVVDDVVSRAEGVFHLAAAVGVQLIVDHPLRSLATNIRGSEIVFEKANKYGTPVLVTSSSEIYGKNRSDRLGEDDDRILGSPLKSRWSYSEAKAIDEILAYTYWKEKGLPTVIVRLFNTVGPRQTGAYGMVVPRFVAQALRGEPITVFGDGAQTRCFCYVGDIVSALPLLITNPDAHGRVFNLGSTEEVSVAELAEVVREETGSDSKVRFVPYEQAYEEGFEDMARRVPDTSRAHGLIGFEPSLSLREIVRMVIEEQRSAP